MQPLTNALRGGTPPRRDFTKIKIALRLLDRFWILAAQNEALDEICSFPAIFLKSVKNSLSYVDLIADFFSERSQMGVGSLSAIRRIPFTMSEAQNSTFKKAYTIEFSSSARKNLQKRAKS